MKSAMAASRNLRTQAAVADAVGVSQTTISRMLRGEGDPQYETKRHVADLLGINLPHLEKQGRDTKSLPDQIALSSSKQRDLVPLISWVQAGGFKESIDPFQPGDAELWVACQRRCGANTFALQVDGKSMEPLYQHRDIIFVDPDVEWTNGADVVVRLEESNEVTFKRIVVENGQTFLMPLNPETKPQRIPLSADARIAGVVIKSGRIK
jgi:SOS-response transcriptional repressor LexA